jgi:hypothetical protein
MTWNFTAEKEPFKFNGYDFFHIFVSWTLSSFHLSVSYVYLSWIQTLFLLLPAQAVLHCTQPNLYDGCLFVTHLHVLTYDVFCYAHLLFCRRIYGNVAMCAYPMQGLKLPGAGVGQGRLLVECNPTPAPHPKPNRPLQPACDDEPALEFGSHHCKENGVPMPVKLTFGNKINSIKLSNLRTK